MLPAKKGDCLLLHCGTKEKPGLILIDGGPAGVWRQTLKPRLDTLRKQRGLSDQQLLVIDLVIVSHVDDDHINGVIALLEFIKARRDGRDHELFKIKGLWHNSFDDIVGNDESVALIASSGFGAASTASVLMDDSEPGPPQDAAFVLASVKQGDDLRRLAKALAIPINDEFEGPLIQTTVGKPTVVEVADVDFTILGPRRPELQKLQRDYDTWLKKQPARPDANSVLAALDDESVANLSSIVLLASDATKTILLTGDARSDKIILGLEESGLVAPGAVFSVDVLKSPHHGSVRNIDAAFVKRIDASHHLFSGDGEHGNPDRETFELLRDHGPPGLKNFVLSYTLAEIDDKRRKEHAKEQAKHVSKGRAPGPDWSDARHSLQAILQPPPAGVTVVEPGASPIKV
jgi:hypothetical protein